MIIIDCWHFVDPLITVLIGRMGFEGEFFIRCFVPTPEPYFEIFA